MKKTLVTLMLALSLFSFASMASAAEAKYYIDGKEVTYEQFMNSFDCSWAGGA